MVVNIGSALSAYKQTMDNAAQVKGGEKAANSTGASFEETLKTFIGDAIDTIKEGEKAAIAGASGKANLQEVVIAVANAEIMMQTVTAVRDKVINAYQEIIRTAI